MLNPGAWPVHPELLRSVQMGRLCACSAAAIQICRLDASDGGAYRYLPPRFICGDQESLQLQEKYGIGYARSLIEQLKDGFANYCVRQPFVLVSVHGGPACCELCPYGRRSLQDTRKLPLWQGRNLNNFKLRY
ncbi:hypothetical protein [Pantoea sp. PGP6]